MSKKKEIEELNIKGAKSIVRDYLKLKKGEYFLIICDETTREIADYVKPKAAAVGTQVDVFQYNTDLQAKVMDRDTFPFELADMIGNAQCILNVVSAKPECTEFRRQVIRIGQKFGTRIAHVPGLQTEHLRIAFQADFYEMKRWNAILVRLLYFAKTCTIITRDRKRNEYKLQLKLGGTDRHPAQSGEVKDGSWCNIPGSEVYIAPLEETASGEIIINGSMLGHALKADVLIRFNSGRIENWKTEDPIFQKVLDKFAETWKVDPNWNCLSEFGLGINFAFKKITGNQLLDEKMGGTCHIAIGTSKEFGGRIDSRIHQDLVTISPTIFIDGKKVIEKGKFKIDETDVFEDLSRIDAKESHFVGKKFRLTNRDKEEQDGKLELDFNDSRNQSFSFQVGNDKTSRKLLKVMNELIETPDFSYEDFKSKFEQAPAILTILMKYNFIKQL